MSGGIASADSEAVAVVRRHLDAVAAGTDPTAMARDYTEDAVVVRPGMRLVGRAAIAAYFAEVPSRLGGGRVMFGVPVCEDGDVVFGWHIVGGPADGTSGSDRCTVVGDAITVQVVRLHDADF